MTKATKKKGTVTFKPGKNIVASMVGDFKKEMKQAMDDGAVELVIDLTGVKMMDSMGIGVLIAAHNSLDKNEGRLELIKCPDNIVKLLTQMRLNEHFKIK